MRDSRGYLAVAAVLMLVAVTPTTAGIVPGGGPAASDCYAVLDVQGVESSSVQKGKKITCTDGDACDAGTCGDGRCTMRTAVCVNQSGLSGCTPPGSLQQLKVRGKASLPIPALEGAVCAAAGDVDVPTKKGKKPGKLKLTMLAKAPKGTKPPKDVDSVQMICLPRTTDCPGPGPGPGPTVTHPGGSLEAPETWTRATHVLEGTLYLRATLTVEACSVIKMPIGGKIVVTDNGALKLIGRADCPITLTTSKSVGSPGDWDSIEFYQTSTGPENILQHTVLEYGGDDTYGAVWIQEGASVEISNSVFRRLRGAGIYADNNARLRDFSGNSFLDIEGVPLNVGITVASDLRPATFVDNQEQAVALRSGTVDRDTTWRNLGVPYVVDDFSIRRSTGSATLTVEAGTTIKLRPGTIVKVLTNGALNLAGTAGAPVTFTSSKSSPAPGDWAQIEVYADSIGSNNAMTYAVIEYGGSSTYGLLWLQDGASMAVSNSTFRQSGDVGIHVAGGSARLPGFSGNTLVDNARGPISLPASVVADLGAGVYTPNGIEGIIIRGGTVSQDATWNDLGVRYLVANDFDVNRTAGTATLTVNAGATIALDQGRSIAVRSNGRLNLAGTSSDRVTITSSKASPAPGDWREIDIYSTGNTWTYADISYGCPAASPYGQVWLGSAAALTTNNVVFANSGSATGCDVYRSSGATFTPTATTATTCP